VWHHPKNACRGFISTQRDIFAPELTKVDLFSSVTKTKILGMSWQ